MDGKKTVKKKAVKMTEKKEAKGRAKGGHARAEALPAERLSEIGKKGAAARWGEKPPKATHRGNFKDEFGIDVECYVLDDEQKTAVISQRGMGAAIGLGQSSGVVLPRFLKTARMAPYITPELAEKVANPIVFQWSAMGTGTGANAPLPGSGTVHGYDVTILIDICKTVLKAHEDGKVFKDNENVVKQAHIIVNASAKAGIKGLVYALAGYDATKAEVIAAFRFYVREEAREYEKEFPNQLYEEWYRIYDLPKPERNRPWKFMHLTIEQVYKPLARSNGKILALTREKKANSDDPRAKLHQFLSEIGVKALRTHLGQLLGIAQVSDDQAQYEKRVNKVFGIQQMLDFDKAGESSPTKH